jgi:uncharacterized RDD family membrane protein YckC
MDPVVEPILETQPLPSCRFPSFWRRVGALAVDSLVLAALGFPLGLLLGERFAPVGTPARLIGLLVLMPYLGLMGSRIGGGQTIGKRVLRLRVVDSSGQPLPMARSFVRAALLSVPWVFNGIRFGSLEPAVVATLWVGAILVFGVGGAIIGTYVLNRPTRQALHDLLVGSYVIQADGVGLAVPTTSTRRPFLASMIWLVVVAVATTAMLALGPSLMNSQLPLGLMETVAAIPGASSFEVNSITTWGAGTTSKVVVAVLWFHGPPEDTKVAAQEVAAAVMQHRPDAATASSLVVTVVRGWDVGIASRTNFQNFTHTPAQWRAELGL